MKLTTPVVDEREVDAVRKVLESGWLTEGPVTRQFEATVASYVGSKYAVATTNCTVALELCLKAYKVTGEVLIPDFTHHATALAVINAGATPVLSDVDLQTYNISPISHNWADIVILVSWGGNPVGYYPHVCIEDAACSLGSEWHGVKTGSRETTCFSFHPRKTVTCGQGGMITTNDLKIANRLRELKKFGEGGTNSQLCDVLSAIGLVQMEKIDKIIDRRIEMARIYSELLREVPNVKVPEKHENAKHTYQTYAVYLECDIRDTIIERLRKKGIETQIGTYALHLLPQFKKLKRIGPLTNSTKLYHHLLALPMAYDLTEEDQKHVVTELKNYL